MLYEFKCKATGNLIMTQAVGDQVLDLIGKRAPQGVITALEMPIVIKRLKAAMNQAKSADPSDQGQTTDQDNPDDEDLDQPEVIPLSRRLVPLIEMLERAYAAEKDVVWGVD